MNNLIGKNLTAGYGGVDIIKDINLQVKEGEIAVSYTHLTLPTKRSV